MHVYNVHLVFAGVLTFVPPVIQAPQNKVITRVRFYRIVTYGISWRSV